MSAVTLRGHPPRCHSCRYNCPHEERAMVMYGIRRGRWWEHTRGAYGVFRCGHDRILATRVTYYGWRNWC